MGRTAAVVLIASLLIVPSMRPAHADQPSGQPRTYILLDKETAGRIWLQAANEGDPAAQLFVANMYMSGDGVPRDYAEAAKWYRKAAEGGNADAQYGLGVLYFDGVGVPRDVAEAAKWYRKAADRGNADAQYEIGLIYANNEGVPQDFVLAYLYLDLAATNFASEEDRQMAEGYRGFVAAKLTPAQISEAQRLAREWKPNLEK